MRNDSRVCVRLRQLMLFVPGDDITNGPDVGKCGTVGERDVERGGDSDMVVGSECVAGMKGLDGAGIRTGTVAWDLWMKVRR